MIITRRNRYDIPPTGYITLIISIITHGYNPAILFQTDCVIITRRNCYDIRPIGNLTPIILSTHSYNSTIRFQADCVMITRRNCITCSNSIPQGKALALGILIIAGAAKEHCRFHRIAFLQDLCIQIVSFFCFSRRVFIRSQFFKQRNGFIVIPIGTTLMCLAVIPLNVAIQLFEQCSSLIVIAIFVALLCLGILSLPEERTCIQIVTQFFEEGDGFIVIAIFVALLCLRVLRQLQL